MHRRSIPTHTRATVDGARSQNCGISALITLFFAGGDLCPTLFTTGLLPLIATDLQVTADQAALLISASTIGLAAAVIPWSFVGDRLGRKPAMTISIIAASLFGLGATLAPTFGFILGFRILEGVALGGVPALAMAYLNEEVHPASAGQSAGTFIAGTVLGGLLGRIVAAPIGEWYHWRFGMGAVLGVAIASAVCFLFLTPTAKKFDPTTTSIRQAITAITTNLRSPVLVVMYLQGMLLMGGFVAVYNFLGFYLVDDPFNFQYPWCPGVSGLLTGTVSSPWAGRMAARYRPSRVLMALSATMIMAMLLTLVPNIWVLLIGVLVFTEHFGAHWALRVGRRCPEGGRAQSTSLYNVLLRRLIYLRMAWWHLPATLRLVRKSDDRRVDDVLVVTALLYFLLPTAN